ncbi:GerMN domain-containing protein [Actinomyces sp. ZJ308]|uniref:GerMN domain-containing protein n=1 Tax=Actinomyces sp. ZJ308 TaxID=2708342 RepID=UPI00141E2DC2|nr:GerMN domain-containing protein [Actinomyces sp. ZJ308]
MRQQLSRTALTEGREHTGSSGLFSLSRRDALGLLSATAAGLLAGCTALPSSSGVTRSGVAASDTNALIETAPGPGEGDSAEDVVNGFLRAAIAGFSDDFATAKQFLTERTAAQWKPLESVSAYSGSTEPQVSVAADGSFTVTSGQVGVLDSLGVFTPALEGATYVGEFSLATNSTGQWRIVGLPHGILLPFSRLMQNFAVSSLAFLSRDRTRFVCELRWYPRSSQADSLVAGLLAGPSDWLSKGAFSLIPRNAESAGRGVVVETGTATVHLSADSDPASEEARQLMVAQIEQSLLQISGIDRVRVLAGTVDLGAAAQLTPMAPEVGGIVGMSEGSVVRGTGASRITLATDRVLGTDDARSPSLGADGAVYALSASSLLHLPQGQESAAVILSVGDPSAGAGGLGAPLGDRHGWAWLLADGQLTAVNGSGQRAALESSWLPESPVVAFDLSVESERIAVRRADGRVAVAVIIRDQDGRPQGLGPALEMPRASGAGTRGVSWCAPNAVCVLADAGAEGGGVPEVRLIQVGGAVNTLVGVRGAHSVISDRSEESLIIIDEAGQTWQRRGAMWRVLTSEVTDPSFPLP